MKRQIDPLIKSCDRFIYCKLQGVIEDNLQISRHKHSNLRFINIFHGLFTRIFEFKIIYNNLCRFLNFLREG